MTRVCEQGERWGYFVALRSPSDYAMRFGQIDPRCSTSVVRLVRQGRLARVGLSSRSCSGPPSGTATARPSLGMFDQITGARGFQALKGQPFQVFLFREQIRYSLPDEPCLGSSLRRRKGVQSHGELVRQLCSHCAHVAAY